MSIITTASDGNHCMFAKPSFMKKIDLILLQESVQDSRICLGQPLTDRSCLSTNYTSTNLANVGTPDLYCQIHTILAL